jgi:outer membrane protein OmpA-like peptidoglycan-associated protein
MERWPSRISVLVVLLLAGWAGGATPSVQPGLQLAGFEPTPPGQPAFLVDVPRFGTDSFSVGLNLNYAHKPLVLGVERPTGEFQTLRVLIEHQVIGQLDLAATLCDCAGFSLSLPLVLMERGDSSEDGSEDRSASPHAWRPGAASSVRGFPGEQSSLASPVALRGVGMREPRLGMLVRLYGQPDTSPFSVSAGGYLWLPLRRLLEGTAPRTSEEEFRVMPRLVLAGYSRPLQWSLTGSYLYRPEARQRTHPALGGDPAGSELGLGAHVGYTDKQRGFSLGPEARLTTVVDPRKHAFKPFYTSLEVLLGLHFQVGRTLQVGLAAGAGLMRQPGTPDFRFMLRISSTRPLQREAPEAPAPPPPRETRGGAAPLPLALPLSIPLPPLAEGPPEAPGNEASAPEASPEGLVTVKDGMLRLQRQLTFAPNRDVLLEESLPVLRAVADTLRASPWIQRIRIEGHTDNQGSPQANHSLSIRRAQSVMRWLREDGIPPARMEAAGHGPSRPIAGNDTEQGRATNRRVDIVLLAPPLASVHP